ncbi:MAG: hypothetical protein ACI87W_000242 [Halieaceae bacterium]|jgi:hypothetical protein
MIRDSRGKRPQFYDTPEMDQVMSMLMVLASEVSVLADHIDDIERVAAAQGVDLKGGQKTLILDDTALAEREERRQALMRRLFYLMRKETSEAEAADDQARYEETIRNIADGARPSP